MESLINQLGPVLLQTHDLADVLSSVPDEIIIDHYASIINYVFDVSPQDHMPPAIYSIVERAHLLFSANEMLIFLKEVKNKDNSQYINIFLFDQHINMIPLLKPILFDQLIAQIKYFNECLLQNGYNTIGLLNKTIDNIMNRIKTSHAAKALSIFIYYSTDFIAQQENSCIKQTYINGLRRVMTSIPENILCNTWLILINRTNNLKFMGYICYQMQQRIDSQSNQLVNNEYQQGIIQNMIMKSKQQECTSEFYGEIANYIRYLFIWANNNNGVELKKSLGTVVDQIKREAQDKEEIEWQIVGHALQEIDRL